MTWEVAMKLAPLMGGAGLLLVCLVNILRSDGISNANAAVLALAGILFTVPYFTNIALKTPFFEWTAEASTKVAEIKGELARLQDGIDTLLKKAGAPATAPTDRAVVLIYYAPDNRKLAQEMEKSLLRKGYSADALMTDFEEVPADRRGKPGTVDSTSLLQAKLARRN